MKSQSMSASEFRAEVKGLSLNQSSFAALAQVPLRTVQSWALGERRIPGTAWALIEKVARMSTKARITGITQTLPEEKLKAFAAIVEVVSRGNKEVKALRDEVQELKGSVSKLQGDLSRLQETCVFQANKLSAYAHDLQKRAEKVVPFNT